MTKPKDPRPFPHFLSFTIEDDISAHGPRMFEQSVRTRYDADRAIRRSIRKAILDRKLNTDDAIEVIVRIADSHDSAIEKRVTVDVEVDVTCSTTWPDGYAR